MKSIKRILLLAVIYGLVCTQNITAQDEQKEENKPVYLTITTAHWSENPDTDYSDWKGTEKLYFDNVTSKNELIISSGVYTHYMTADNSEVVFVNVYKSWGDIEKSNEENKRLAKEAWPNEEERKEFFKKQRGYYSASHSDEIYLSEPYTMQLKEKSDKSLIYYVRKSDLSLNGDGNVEKFKEFFEKITKNTTTSKAYYTHRHLWGSNAREFSEVLVFDNLADIEMYFEEVDVLIEKTWPEKEERKVFFEGLDKLFTGKHGDFVFKNVPELAK